MYKNFSELNGDGSPSITRARGLPTRDGGGDLLLPTTGLGYLLKVWGQILKQNIASAFCPHLANGSDRRIHPPPVWEDDKTFLG